LRMKAFKFILYSQAVYIFLTGVWPIVDIESFMLVTGPKTDIWLVKTVGALLIPVSISMFFFAREKSEKLPVIILCAGTSISFILIDLYYSLSGTISKIYLLDAAVEGIFLVAWVYILISRKLAA
jgi:hypothetical protein